MMIVCKSEYQYYLQIIKIIASHKQLYRRQMTFALFKGIFKQIRILSTKDSYIAQTVRSNLRIHYNHYQKQQQNYPKKPYKQKNDQLLKSFLQFLIQSNQQASQFSQRGKMKLVEIVCNINKFVNNKFQIRNRKSHQMQILQGCNQFKQLSNQKDKDFVVGVLKKVFYGKEKYDYSNLTDFFKDHRFQVCDQGSQNLTKVEPQIRVYVQKILKEKEVTCPYYKRIYEYYFTDVPKQQLGFDSYLNCRYILLDFDDVEQQWNPDQHQDHNSIKAKVVKEKEADKVRQNQRYKYQLRKKAQQELSQLKTDHSEKKIEQTPNNIKAFAKKQKGASFRGRK